MREKVDLEGYLISKVAIKNAMYGSRGYDQGVRTFDCPHCGDDKERGWMNVERWTAGCFRAGCPAEPRLKHGAIQWVRMAERQQSEAMTWVFLLKEYRNHGFTRKSVVPIWDTSIPDFCRMPSMRLIQGGPGVPSIFTRPVKAFLAKQWGLTMTQAERFGLGYSLAGRYEGRIIIPIKMGGKVVGFQARSYRGKEPKYLNSIAGPESDPESECSRPTRAVLYNIDGVPLWSEILLVEGVGDVMGWHKNNLSRMPQAVAIMGMRLSPEKIRMLRELKPNRIIVGLDNEPASYKRAREYAQELVLNDLPGVVGKWEGGKDAGSGAELVIQPPLTMAAKTKIYLGGV